MAKRWTEREREKTTESTGALMTTSVHSLQADNMTSLSRPQRQRSSSFSLMCRVAFLLSLWTTSSNALWQVDAQEHSSKRELSNMLVVEERLATKDDHWTCHNNDAVLATMVVRDDSGVPSNCKVTFKKVTPTFPAGAREHSFEFPGALNPGHKCTFDLRENGSGACLTKDDFVGMDFCSKCSNVLDVQGHDEHGSLEFAFLKIEFGHDAANVDETMEVFAGSNFFPLLGIEGNCKEEQDVQAAAAEAAAFHNGDGESNNSGMDCRAKFLSSHQCCLLWMNSGWTVLPNDDP